MDDQTLGYVAWAHNGEEHLAGTALAAAEAAYARPGRGHKRAPVLVMERKQGGESYLQPGTFCEYVVPLGWWEPAKAV